MNKNIAEKMRMIPSIDVFIKTAEGRVVAEQFGSGVAKFALRGILDGIRGKIKDDPSFEVPSSADIAETMKTELFRLTVPKGRHAINASGIMLHTGLGRAPYADDAVDSLSIFNGYSVLQTDLVSGKRSLRERKIESMLRALTGCEAATVLNNNAFATMLILNAISKNKEVIISRGQLVEIGGSFRMPDVMEQSGAIMKEIGTTNRTHVKDYAAAITEQTGAIMHVHTSNYRVRGFSGTPSIQKLCEFRDKTSSHIPVIDDLGSGGLVCLSQFGLPDEPLVMDSISAGVDLVCFSGDKLICGPQAGIVCGKADFIEKIRKNPFARMFRVGKLTLAVLETTLVHFLNDTYKEKIPFYQMLSRDVDSLTQDAERLALALKKGAGCEIAVIDDVAYVGSGSAPDQGVPDKVLRLKPNDGDTAKLARKLRLNLPSVFCRVKDESLLFNMRTLLKDDLRQLEDALKGMFA